MNQVRSIGKIQDLSAEKAVLALLINHNKETRIHLPEIQDDFFFEPIHQRLFETIKKLTQNNEPIDLITLGKDSEISNQEIMKILQVFPTLGGIKTYLKTLKEFADKRWFISQTNQIDFKDDPQELMTAFSSRIIERLKKGQTERTDIRSAVKEFEVYQSGNAEHLKSGNKYIGMETGYPTIDQVINGIRSHHYWIISAYTNTGKSYFLLNITNRLLVQGKNILFFSLEMSQNQNIGRLLGIETGIDPTEIERGCLEGEQLEQETQAKARLYDQSIQIHTLKKNINDIITTIYAEHSSKPVDLVLIDYLQKVNVPGATSRYERYTVASDLLQHLAKETGIPIIVASQVDNESAKNKNTDIIATKGSGDVGGDADLVLLLKKDEEKFDEIQCYIQKNRHGKKGACQFKFFDGGILSELDNYHN
jgi:replicative DNA helicase